ncbi:MAG: hypothetical protein R2856_11095 [Caldilineaceae bacterium]
MESDPLLDVPRWCATCKPPISTWWPAGGKDGDGKVLASSIYNFVMRRLGGVDVHDGNWIKAMRREVIESLPPLRSDWHRFLLMIAAHQGFRIGEVKTHYSPRQAGSSKFGFSRIPISFLDVLVVRFLLAFSAHPCASLAD